MDGGQFHTYGDIAVSRMELRVQQSMGAARLSLGAAQLKQLDDASAE